MLSNFQTPEFWINNYINSDNLLNEDRSSAIDIPSLENQNPTYRELYNRKKSQTISGYKLKKSIFETSRFAKYTYVYENGRLVENDQLKEIYNRTSIDLIIDSKKYELKYGFCMKRTAIRSFPTDIVLCKENDHLKFDRLSESALYTLEAYIELYKSRDLKWTYVATPSYNGWVQSKDLAYCTFDEWKSYIECEDFLIVTESRVNFMADECEFELYMGSKLNILKNNDGDIYGRFPHVIDKNRKLEFRYKKISNLDDFSYGYLKYNSKNIISLAFKMLGEEYGWGSANNLRDCSSFIQDIYKCFGINIHRNSGDQWELSLGKIYDFGCLNSLDEKKALLKTISPGTAVYKDGHVMLYIGSFDDQFYMIHNAASIYEYDINGALVENRVMKVIVSTFDIMDSNAMTFIDLLHGAKQFI